MITILRYHLQYEERIPNANFFLNKQDMSGALVPKEEESVTPVSKLPWFNFNSQLHGYLACLRPVKGTKQPNHEPFSPLENKLPLTLNSHCIEGH